MEVREMGYFDEDDADYRSSGGRRRKSSFNSENPGGAKENHESQEKSDFAIAEHQAIPTQILIQTVITEVQRRSLIIM